MGQLKSAQFSTELSGRFPWHLSICFPVFLICTLFLAGFRPAPTYAGNTAKSGYADATATGGLAAQEERQTAQVGELAEDDPTLWVSTSGCDENDGTSPQSAFRTIQHAIDQASGGDVIQILAGFYEEQVSVRHRHFTEDDPLIIQGEPGVTIDGGYELTNWEPVSSLNGHSVENTYRTYIGAERPEYERPDWHTVDGKTIYAVHPSRESDPHLFFQDEEIKYFDSWDPLGAVVFKKDGWVHFRNGDGSHPDNFHIRRGRFRSSTVSFRDSSNIVLRNVKLQNAYYTVQIHDSNHITVEGCKIFHGDNGIRISGDSSYNTIARNYVTLHHIWEDFGGKRKYSPDHDAMWRFVKSSSHSNQRGIYFYRCSGSNNLVEENLVYRHWDAFQALENRPRGGMVQGGLSASEREASLGKNTDLIVRNNSFMWSQDSATSIDFGGENFYFYNNRLHEGSNLLRWKGFFHGPAYIYNNVFTARTLARYDTGEHSHPPGTYVSPGDMLYTPAECFLYHNVWAFVPSGISISVSRGYGDDVLGGFRFVNNIFEANAAVASYNSSRISLNALEGYSFYGGRFDRPWPSASDESNMIESNDGTPMEHNRIWEYPEDMADIETMAFSLPSGHAAKRSGINLAQEWQLGPERFSALPLVEYGSDHTPDIGLANPESVGQSFWNYEVIIQEQADLPEGVTSSRPGGEQRE